MDLGAAHQSDTGYFHPIPPPSLAPFLLPELLDHAGYLYMLTLLFETFVMCYMR